MIANEDREMIRRIAKAFAVKRVLLYGSSAEQSEPGRDIDLAVSGIDPSLFFKFYGDLLWDLSKPVDLVDLDRDCRFTRMIRDEGVTLYEHAA